MMRRVVVGAVCAVMVCIAFPLFAGMFDNAWIKGTTDKNPLSYKTGEEMVFTLELQGVDGDIPDGEYTLWWKRSDDFGATEEGSIPLAKTPFVYRTKLEKPGFVRLEAYVVDKDGNRVVKKFTGDTSTPEGRKAMNEFERKKKNVFFDGGAGAEIESLSLAQEAEPADFDEFWARQFARLDKVPIREERIEIESRNPKVRVFAVRIDCAGLRPVTGYLSIPKAVDEGATFPCQLATHGYSGDRCVHSEKWEWYPSDKILLNINAHGLKLAEFGATEADTKALRWEVRSNGKTLEPLWRPPFRVDITDAIQKSADIDLSICVANLWPNRLIGDDILYPDDCEWKGEVKDGVKEIGIKEIPKWVKEGKRSPTGRHTFTTWKHWDKNDKLLPSGLLGPVRLRITNGVANEILWE